MDIKELKQFIRNNGYAWPGGYQAALMMLDGEVIDAQSARENYRLIRRAVSREWTPVQVFIHWEGEPLTCAHSNRQIESTYGIGDPLEKEIVRKIRQPIKLIED